MIIFVLALISVPVSHSIPFIVLHGISDQCSNKGVKQFTEQLIQFSGVEGFCIEVAGGSWDSWFLPLDKQIEIVCNKVKEMKELSEGYNIVGLSQGNLVGRGVLEFCDGGPPVKNFVSLAGPHAGTASVPLCGSGVLCMIANELIKSEIYCDLIQDHLAPSGYLKLPNAIPEYLEHCKFLPKLNNEIPEKRNTTYKERFSSLENLVLIMFEHDNVLIPKETAWFGYYPDGAFTPVLLPQETKLYIEDWIGLRTLDEAGRVKYIEVPGGHLGISECDMKKYVVPYMIDSTKNGEMNGIDTSVSVYEAHQRDLEHEKRKQDVPEPEEEKLPCSIVLEGSSSYDWQPSIRDFLGELLGITEV